MPIYQYRCSKCDKVIEALQKVHDKPLSKCENCGGKLQRIIAPVGIIFKGSGFHVTDYGRAGKTAASVSEEKSKKREKKTETKSEAKTETKAEKTGK